MGSRAGRPWRWRRRRERRGTPQGRRRRSGERRTGRRRQRRRRRRRRSQGGGRTAGEGRGGGWARRAGGKRARRAGVAGMGQRAAGRLPAGAGAELRWRRPSPQAESAAAISAAMTPVASPLPFSRAEERKEEEAGAPGTPQPKCRRQAGGRPALAEGATAEGLAQARASADPQGSLPPARASLLGRAAAVPTQGASGHCRRRQLRPQWPAGASAAPAPGQAAAPSAAPQGWSPRRRRGQRTTGR